MCSLLVQKRKHETWSMSAKVAGGVHAPHKGEGRMWGCSGHLPESHSHTLALTVLYVPYSLDRLCSAELAWCMSAKVAGGAHATHVGVRSAAIVASDEDESRYVADASS